MGVRYEAEGRIERTAGTSVGVPKQSGTRGKEHFLSTGDFQAPVERLKSERPKCDVERSLERHPWKGNLLFENASGTRGKGYDVEREVTGTRGKEMHFLP